MEQTPDNQFGDSARESVSDLLNRLAGSGENPSQSLTDLLAVQCYLGRADRGAIVRGNGRGSVDVIAVYPQLENINSPPEWLVKCAEMMQSESVTDSPVVRRLGQSDFSYAVMIPAKLAGVAKAVAVFCVDAVDEADIKMKSEQLQLLLGLSSYLIIRQLFTVIHTV